MNNVEMFMNIAITEALCCAGVGATSWPFTNRVETLSGKSVAVRRDHEGRVHIGSTTVHDCDIPATNGIIHSVNRVCKNCYLLYFGLCSLSQTNECSKQKSGRSTKKNIFSSFLFSDICE